MLVIIFIKDIAIALMNGCENRIHFEECKGSTPIFSFLSYCPLKIRGNSYAIKSDSWK